MAYLVNSRKRDDVFGQDLWGKMIAGEGQYGSLFSIDYLFSQNFDDWYAQRLRNPQMEQGMQPDTFENTPEGRKEARKAWEGDHTQNPYPYDVIRSIPWNSGAHNKIIGRQWLVSRRPNDKQDIPTGFELNAYKRDFGLVPIYKKKNGFMRMDQGLSDLNNIDNNKWDNPPLAISHPIWGIRTSNRSRAGSF